MGARKWVDELRDDVMAWELAELEEPSCAEDAFSGELSFGTGGIRGLMGVGPRRINRLTIGRVAQGLANWLSERCPGERSVAIGYDTRYHSEDLARHTACVLAKNGIHCHIFAGFQPTPVLDYAVRALSCDAGICITASHNPREYNGFKVYGPDGVQVTDALARQIQECITPVDVFGGVRAMGFEKARSAGLIDVIDDEVVGTYLNMVLMQRLGVDCTNLKVVYSPLGGTGLRLATTVLESLGASVATVESQLSTDGAFNGCPKPNPENPDAMQEGIGQMVAEGADLLLATDPDADRVGLACLHGGEPYLLTGNELGLLLLDYVSSLHESDCDVPPVSVTTIVTTPLADRLAEIHGFELRRTLTGFKYIGEQIGLIERADREFLLGFEESCGYLRGRYVRDKDGINAIMLACELVAYHKACGRDLVEALDDLHQRLGFVLDRQVTMAFEGARSVEVMRSAMHKLRSSSPSHIAGLSVIESIDYLPGAPMPVVGGSSDQVLPPSDVLEWRLEGGSRVLLRPSGTEPKLKAYIFSCAGSHQLAGELLAALEDDVRSLIYGAMEPGVCG